MCVRRLGEGSSNITNDYKNFSIENNFLIKFQNFCRKHFLVTLYWRNGKRSGTKIVVEDHPPAWNSACLDCAADTTLYSAVDLNGHGSFESYPQWIVKWETSTRSCSFCLSNNRYTLLATAGFSVGTRQWNNCRMECHLICHYHIQDCQSQHSGGYAAPRYGTEALLRC